MIDALAGTFVVADGLTSAEARRRLAQHGPNQPASRSGRVAILKVLAPFVSPLSLVLIAAAVVSAVLGDPTGAGIIIAIVLAGSAINLAQTWRSSAAMRRLQEQVAPTASVLRDAAWREIPRTEVVPGDVIRLCAGDLVPADARLLTARDLHVQQAALTGESLPAEKEAQSSRAEGPLRLENRFPLGFVPLPAEYLALVALGTLLYLVLAELAKRLLLRRAIGES